MHKLSQYSPTHVQSPTPHTQPLRAYPHSCTRTTSRTRTLPLHTLSHTNSLTNTPFLTSHKLAPAPPPPSPQDGARASARAAAAALFGREPLTASTQHRAGLNSGGVLTQNQTFPSKYKTVYNFSSCRFPPENHKSYFQGCFTSL